MDDLIEFWSRDAELWHVLVLISLTRLVTLLLKELTALLRWRE
jgi:hypothetical protein